MRTRSASRCAAGHHSLRPWYLFRFSSLIIYPVVMRWSGILEGTDWVADVMARANRIRQMHSPESLPSSCSGTNNTLIHVVWEQLTSSYDHVSDRRQVQFFVGRAFHRFKSPHFSLETSRILTVFSALSPHTGRVQALGQNDKPGYPRLNCTSASWTSVEGRSSHQTRLKTTFECLKMANTRTSGRRSCSLPRVRLMPRMSLRPR